MRDQRWRSAPRAAGRGGARDAAVRGDPGDLEAFPLGRMHHRAAARGCRKGWLKWSQGSKLFAALLWKQPGCQVRAGTADGFLLQFGFSLVVSRRDFRTRQVPFEGIRNLKI